MRYRLIKPDWGKPDNIIPGPNVIEGEDFTDEFLEEKNNEGYNVYYFPNHNSKPIDHNYLRGSDVDVFQCCFVDMDLKDGIYESCEQFLEILLNEPLVPNHVVFSGNGLHAYWYVSDLDVNSYLELQLRLIQKYKTDESIWTALQLMRLPGYNNTKKRDEFKPVILEVTKASEPYTVADLRDVLPELTRENSKKLDMHIKKLNGAEELVSLDEESIEIPEKFLEFLQKSKKIQELWGAEQGDRSEADYALACILYDKDYSKADALAVILNTSKALSKGPHRKSYAVSVVNSAYSSKSTHYVPSAAEKLAAGNLRKDRGKLVNGPELIDCMTHGWRTSEILGLIGSSNSGKTSITLDAFYNMINNNPEDDDIFIFFSLEMEDYKIIEQWQAITFDAPHLAERFYVVSNEDDDGSQRYLNLQDIYNYVKDISKATGKKVKAIAIDHIAIINKSIDIKKKPDFGLSKRDDLGFGNNRTLSDRELTKFIKGMAKELDCFVIVQSQTTKEKASEGDVPLGMGAAYGIAQFEWDMDYILTIWQPLKRVQGKTDLAVTAFQYCKNRFRNKKDKVKVYDPRALFIDLDSGRFRGLTAEEFEDCNNLIKEANVLRKLAEKKESTGLKNAADIDKVKELFGKKVHLQEAK